MTNPAQTGLCDDRDLGYERSRTLFQPGHGLRLDETYRLAHLPLAAPDHPRIIPSRDGAPYARGRRPETFSLVLPIANATLRRTGAYDALERELRESPIGAKIAWDIAARRRDKLHATLCGLAPGDGGTPPCIDATQRRALRGLGPVAFEARGLFSGNVNVGRLYLRVYPARKASGNALQEIQSVLGARQTDLYLVGVFNLIDDLDAAETAALSDIIARWWERPLLRADADHLFVLASKDDLTLDSRVVETVALI